LVIRMHRGFPTPTASRSAAATMPEMGQEFAFSLPRANIRVRPQCRRWPRNCAAASQARRSTSQHPRRRRSSASRSAGRAWSGASSSSFPLGPSRLWSPVWSMSCGLIWPSSSPPVFGRGPILRPYRGKPGRRRAGAGLVASLASRARTLTFRFGAKFSSLSRGSEVTYRSGGEGIIRQCSDVETLGGRRSRMCQVPSFGREQCGPKLVLPVFVSIPRRSPIVSAHETPNSAQCTRILRDPVRGQDRRIAR